MNILLLRRMRPKMQTRVRVLCLLPGVIECGVWCRALPVLVVVVVSFHFLVIFYAYPHLVATFVVFEVRHFNHDVYIISENNRYLPLWLTPMLLL